MTGYEQYVDDVENNKIITCEYIKLAIKRFKSFIVRDDIYFDAEKVNDVIVFISKIKHYLGKTAGKNFILEKWQEFVLANIFGFYYKENNRRVTRNVFMFMARKQGKSAFMSAITLYLLIAEGEESPEIIFAANSSKQARILLDMALLFAKSLDPKQQFLKLYRNDIKFKPNNGKIQVVSSDTSRLDGLNASSYIIDEFHEAKDTKMIDVLSSSQGMRENPLGIIITTAGSNLEGPCKKKYDTSIEILKGLKSDDSIFSAIYTLDIDDNWQNEKNWIKSNPNLDVTVEKSFIKSEVLKAKNNSSDEFGVKTKTINIWCGNSELTWLQNELIVKHTKEINLDDFVGCSCYVGVDLAEVEDLTAVSILIEKENKFYFKTIYLLPESALLNHSEQEKYKNWYRQKELIITNGVVTDYTYITNYLIELNQSIRIETVFYDSWHSAQWSISATEAGLNMQVFSQSLANFTRSTREFERQIKLNNIIIDNNEITRFCFRNVVLKSDHNNNVKPTKTQHKNKIDGVIAMLMAFGWFLITPKIDNTIFTF